MYTKEQLEQMDVAQLMEIAGQLGVKVSQNDKLETVIYDILDKAAIDSPWLPVVIITVFSSG